MKKNLKKLLVMAFLCFIVSAVSAQSNLTWPQKRQLLTTKLSAALKDSLNLSPEKITKVQDINSKSKYQQQFAAIAADASLSADDKKAKYTEVYKAKREELKKEITPEQINKMEAIERVLRKEIGV